MNIELANKLTHDIELLMREDLKKYEASHGIDVNFHEFALILRNNNQVIGVLNGYTAYAEIYINDMWVLEKYRGKGFGKSLIAELEKIFSGKGYNNINLVTSAFQAPSFYVKCGFTPEFTRINKINPQFNKTFFVKYFNENIQKQGLIAIK